MGLVRLLIFGGIGLTILYFLISIYSKSVRRERLENQWAEDHPEGGDETAREAFVERGMADYESSFRPKLILLVYVIPAIFVVVIHFVTTYT
ncbi:hypothetical protein [Rhodalgimonas zhirmunskyi]|uniref:Cation/multidrug efflux pump n=1 Tax=Rhodalgimonas zhirmunskyi TaxID=2964767 RepID=A0AAJ1X5X9_9RHOB|nr:hypothetical protein [Rhodoalgimonas zhirmunskyi]MDQ2094104.1 hypothetical protein [Rhodoalgimonas zhirmunskyi]